MHKNKPEKQLITEGLFDIKREMTGQKDETKPSLNFNKFLEAMLGHTVH